MTLLKLATNYRTAINSAFENKEFSKIPFSRFPKECCDLTCVLLAQFLEDNNFKTIQINGIHKDDHLWHHQWLCLDESEIVVDITGDQFNQYNFFEEDIPQVHVGTEGKIHKLFCSERKTECNTNFTDPSFFDTIDGRPNPRQQTLIDINNIISKYL